MIEMLKPKPARISMTRPVAQEVCSFLPYITSSSRAGIPTSDSGQEINLLTSAIARMNLFLHGVEDFHIERDTLGNPKFVENGVPNNLTLFCQSTIPIKHWDRAKGLIEWGRNKYGTPREMLIIPSSTSFLAKPNQAVQRYYSSWILFRDQERNPGTLLLTTCWCVIGLSLTYFIIQRWIMYSNCRVKKANKKRKKSVYRCKAPIRRV